MEKFRTAVRSYYHFIKASLSKFFLPMAVRGIVWLLPDSYRREIVFFEDIKSQTYKDNEFLLKQIRMAAHFVDKTFTLSKKMNRAAIAMRLEGMVKDVRQEKESDKTTCQWADQVLSYYHNPIKEGADKTGMVPAGVADTLFDLIKARRSIRSYTNQKIEENVLRKILESGLWSPSSCNRQPIEYLIVNDSTDVLLCQKYAGEYACFPQEAAVNIVVLVDPRAYVLPHQRHMVFLDGGAAIQNILLTAHSFGLGACWMFWAKHDGAFNEKFSLSPWLLPVGLICIGYINKPPPIVPKRKSIMDTIHDARGK